MNLRTDTVNRGKDALTAHQFEQFGPAPINPFRTLRAENNLTIKDLCQRTYVSKQAVIRLEQGTFNEPLPSVLDWFVKSYGLSELELCDRYAEYQNEVRKRHHHLFGPDLRVPNDTVHPFRYLRDKINFSITEVSKALCVPQSALDRFEKKWRVQKTVPRTLTTALYGAGYSGHDLAIFQRQYEVFRNRSKGVVTSG